MTHDTNQGCPTFGKAPTQKGRSQAVVHAAWRRGHYQNLGTISSFFTFCLEMRSSQHHR